MKNSIKKDFTIIPNELINDSELDMKARFIFIYLASKPEDWKYYNRKMEADLKCEKDTRIKYTKQLVDRGWISIEQQILPGGKFGPNEITLNPYRVKTAALPLSDLSNTVENRSDKKPPLNKTDNNTNNELFTNTDCVPLPHQVLNYLNEKRKAISPAAKGFNLTPANMTEIKTRIKEKYTIDDFKIVIDAAIIEWGQDDERKKYLRPETLFGKKFDGYLVNAADTIKKSTNPKQKENENAGSTKQQYVFSAQSIIDGAGVGTT